MKTLNLSNGFFTIWLDGMGNIHLTAIITNQCESIKRAVREIMPDIVHRFYMWHIMCKVPEKFKHIREFSKAKSEFKALVCDSLTIPMFEEYWNKFLTDYGLERNDWLAKLWSKRKSWVPVYLKHLFWAGMVSTQRSKSMHSYFNGYEITLSDKI